MDTNITMESLLQFLEDISCISMDDTECLDDTKLDSLCTELMEIYSDSDFRHSYYLISKSLEKYSPDVYASMTTILLQIIHFFETNKLTTSDLDSRRILKSMQKLLDHVELEGLRLDRMKAVAHYSEVALQSEHTAILRTDGINSQWNKIKSDIRRVEKQVKSYHSQSVTILGIFSALVLSVAAEISVFSESFSKLSGDNFLMILFFVSFIGLVIFDTIFMLMYTVSKIVGIPISVSSDLGNCNACPNRETKFHKSCICKLWRKYPYVVLFNVILILSTSLFGFCSLWYLRK